MSQDYQTHWLTPKREIFLDPSVRATTHTLTPATLANPSHNSRIARVHPHTEPQLKGCHSEPQLKGYHSEPPLRKWYNKVHP